MRYRSKRMFLSGLGCSGLSESFFSGYMIFIAVGTLLFLIPLVSRGQQDTLRLGDELEIDEVVVSARRTPVVYSRLSRIVTTAEEEEIDKLPVSTIHEVLDHISGVDVRQRGPLGVQSDLSIRGSSFDQNLILLNGIDITDPQTGHFALNLPVNLSDVKEIEVLKGPGSRVFGPNAFGGAVNIITSPSDSNQMQLQVMGGGHGLWQATAHGSFRLAGMRHHLSFSRSSSEGYMENTDFSTYSFYYQGVKDWGGGDRLQIQMGHKDKAYGAQSFYTPQYPEQYEQARVTLMSVGIKMEGALDIHPAIYWRRHRDRFELFREGDGWYERENGYWVKPEQDTAKYVPGVFTPQNYYSGHNYHMTDIYGSKLNSSFRTVLGRSAFGFDIRSEQIWSNVLGTPRGDTLQAKGEPHGYYDKQYHRTLVNFYGEHNVYMGNLSVSAGILVSRSNAHQPGWKYYPGVDLSYQLSSWLTAYSSYNRSLRMPTFTDLFYEGPSNVGNPDLDPEKIQAYEAGVKVHSGVIRGHASWFYHDADDLIAWSRKDDSSLQVRWKAQNLTQLVNQGVELSLTLQIDQLLNQRIPVDRLSLHYTHMDQQKLTPGHQSKYSLNYPDHQLKMNLSGHVGRLHYFISADYHDRAGKYLNYDFNKQQYTGEVVFKPYWMFDTKLAYRWDRWKFYLEATNLFDQRHSDIGNIRLPGRWIRLGIDRSLSLARFYNK